ncbi:endolytic transglycosylase MltG [Mangrovibacillus cuniculi]|uniref:Endolytic murein transglycosylase n=1 Tax=Mangrovibacillus cuniculi TaxID=2593652 RepID=A0A7S8CBL7_9BACI|nr:endolytic transglycosylase MltG [Mangrovibacillus cuniculi]QPC46989.1 endolytic transglycosylase MltG [Mangrovibacillus cuniculi]
MSNEDQKSFKDRVRESKLQKQQEAKTIRKIVLIVTSVLVAIILAVGIAGYVYISSSLKAVEPTNEETKTVEIPIGSGVTTIGNILEKNGLIKNKTIFRYYVRFNNHNNFQAGTYQLSPSMNIDELISQLQTGKVMREAQFKLTVPEGLQLVEISEVLAEKLNMSSEEVFTELNDQEFVEKLMNDYPNLLSEEVLGEEVKYPLEGYLFPATYEFYEENPSLEDMVREMLNKTNAVVGKFQTDIAGSEMTTHEVLTFASIVEEEAPSEEDRQMMASVFYNRMEKGMPLQTDPTVLYAMGKHKERVLYEYLETDSPYNTYKNQGLPPGPIANSGESAIRAVLNPAETDYFYFLAATETGKVYYSKTYSEHNDLIDEHIKND